MRKGAVILKRLGDKRNVISIQDYERRHPMRPLPISQIRETKWEFNDLTERERKQFWQAIDELQSQILYAKLEAKASDLLILMNGITFEKLAEAYKNYVVYACLEKERHVSVFGIEIKIDQTLGNDQFWIMKRICEVNINYGEERSN